MNLCQCGLCGKEVRKEGNKYILGHNPSINKNKTNIEVYGKEKASQISLKISNSHMGLKNPHTKEWCEKISQSNKGRISPMKDKKLTDEHKRKIGLGNKGKIHTDEMNKKTSESGKGRIPWNKNKKGYKIMPCPEEKKRKISKANSGPNHFNYINGNSIKYPDDWTVTLRKSIRERDNYICKLCGRQQEDRVHSIHHIDYDKNNCNPNNLITLCVNCHMKTDFKREHYKKYFTDLMISKEWIKNDW